ncbi:hypothetical protein ACLB2K_069588 [Fragaria x ananassa]
MTKTPRWVPIRLNQSRHLGHTFPRTKGQNRSYNKRTRGGKITKVVREHYLRDDIYCGAPVCQKCNNTNARLSAAVSTVLVLDTNVVLNQIDLIENAAINDVVVLSIVLEEDKNRNLSVYNRLRAICSNSLRNFYVFSNEHHKVKH